MEKIVMTYVDDRIDRGIARYLGKYKPEKADLEIDYNEITFEKNYDSIYLTKELKNKNTNLLIIDSALYMTSEKRKIKYHGEEIKTILKFLLPYIETIVISQNKQEEDNPYGIVQKYSLSNSEDRDEEAYYNKILREELEKKIKEILMSRKIYKELVNKQKIENELLEKIKNSLDGEDLYRELNSEDLDKIIEDFKELKRVLSE